MANFSKVDFFRDILYFNRSTPSPQKNTDLCRIEFLSVHHIEKYLIRRKNANFSKKNSSLHMYQITTNVETIIYYSKKWFPQTYTLYQTMMMST